MYFWLDIVLIERDLVAPCLIIDILK